MTILSESIYYDAEQNQYFCHGNWTIHGLSQLQAELKHLRSTQPSVAAPINGADIKKFDTAGAWLLINWQKQNCQDIDLKQFIQFSPQHYDLLKLVAKQSSANLAELKPERYPFFERVGRFVFERYYAMRSYLAFVGLLSIEFIKILFKPTSFRLKEVVAIIYRNGFLALPIIAMLSFMIGVVLAYQMGLQLRNYGATIYIVDLLGLAILREFGPLLTAIIVAGRTGSSYTAQLGMMKINQEIDALNTMGVAPAGILLLPRIIGLLIALPLLAMWANIFGILGGMVMSNSMLNVPWQDFLTRFPNVIKLKNLYIGIGKTPIFALIISSIGCYQGMLVQGSAESVGRNTTRSVVLGIFFIIVADAMFSIIFSRLHL